MKFCRQGCFGFAICLSILATAERAEAVSYAITDLGTSGNGVDINSSGQVIIASDAATYLYSGGTSVFLGNLPGGYEQHVVGRRINDAGEVVGFVRRFSFGSLVDIVPFLYSGGTMINVGSLGWRFGGANGINNAGQVVGHSATLDPRQHAFLYSGGVMTDLESMGGTIGGNYAEAIGINDSAQIVGWATEAQDAWKHGFFFSGGVMIDLGTLGGYQSSASSINNAGDIVGTADTGDVFGTQHGFLYSNGSMTDLGSFSVFFSSYANDINNLGWIVGSAFTPDAVQHALLRISGLNIDLNETITPGSGWVLQSANGINDFGQIVGHGIFEGETHAFLLNPILVPEPTALTLVALGLGLFTLTTRRCRGAR